MKAMLNRLRGTGDRYAERIPTPAMGRSFSEFAPSETITRLSWHGSGDKSGTSDSPEACECCRRRRMFSCGHALSNASHFGWDRPVKQKLCASDPLLRSDPGDRSLSRYPRDVNAGRKICSKFHTRAQRACCEQVGH